MAELDVGAIGNANFGSTPIILSGALNRSIVEISNQISGVTAANYTSQLNNFGAIRETLGKNIVEIDLGEGIAMSEATTRVSPVSQAHIQSMGTTQLAAAMQSWDDRFMALSMKLNSIDSKLSAKV